MGIGPTPREVAEAMIGREGVASLLAHALDEVSEGYARVLMEVRADMINGHGTAHGGLIFALADSAFAYACNSRNQVTVAQHGSISFLAPARLGDVLVAEARETGLVGRAGSYVVTVTVLGGGLVATFHGLSRSVGGTILPEEQH